MIELFMHDHREGIVGPLILLAAWLGAASAAEANVTFNTGPASITLASNRSWTIYSMTWNGYAMMVGNSSNFNGTVLGVDGTWAGSGHGNETVLGTTLWVDGILTPFVDGSTYNGQTIQFARTTILGSAYQLTSTLTATGAGTVERVVLDGLNADKSVDAGHAYAFLGRRTGLKSYAAYNARGEILSSGTCDGGEDFIYLQPAVAVAQYDSVAQKGVVSQITLGADQGLVPFIWDRGDNKMYNHFTAIEGPAATTKRFLLCQTVTPFAAAPDVWQSTAGALVTPEPGSIALLLAALIGLGAYALRKRKAIG